jgi:hypothetical protein
VDVERLRGNARGIIYPPDGTVTNCRRTGAERRESVAVLLDHDACC